MRRVPRSSGAAVAAVEEVSAAVAAGMVAVAADVVAAAIVEIVATAEIAATAGKSFRFQRAAHPVARVAFRASKSSPGGSSVQLILRVFVSHAHLHRESA